ncbi:hypothetical protein FC093_16690 [Ilyomonas limi]|uniref:Uncharacterized protein n=1 Tax=Ilyomonas limi TaxID=2575867 RepID=A0A4V5UTV6_9BACT|nr:hypothetical protein [Ilyomonas limi]TKK66673.1 hypothetical protein FC093_16690 [Ilyomonas limi]
MKSLLLILLCVIISLHFAYAQSNAWFKGMWYGERTFLNSRIAKKALVRMEVDKIKDSSFTGRLIYMYPSDTAARLIRRVGGVLRGKYIIINKSEEIYRNDPRSRSFWSDCSHCPGSSSFYITGGNLVLQITTSACGDTCNGVTVFYRKMQDYNASMQATLVKAFGTNKAPAAVVSYVAANTNTKESLVAARDSIKYFPTLLNDSMGIHFDPNKYQPLSAISMDAAPATKQDAALNKMAKKNVPAPKKTVVKDSAVNKKGNTNAVTVSDAKPPATKKDTLAALPTLVKDTMPAAIAQRKTNLINTYEVNSPHIAVQLYDDGQIDGDAVSVYYNGKIIISNQTLTHKAITFNIDAAAASRHHEFILISESEGFLPPNTALMRIKAGIQQFELNVSSSSASNAKIAINYVGE